MKHRTRGRLLRRTCLIMVLCGAPLLLTGGCPIDSADLTTGVVQAALESVTTSLVDSLSTYLSTR